MQKSVKLAEGSPRFAWACSGNGGAMTSPYATDGGVGKEKFLEGYLVASVAKMSCGTGGAKDADGPEENNRAEIRGEI